MMSAATVEITLDAINWRSKSDFYASYCNATRAPTWFGNNLDAFHDSLRGGICKITPEKISIRHFTSNVRACVGHEFWKSVEEICVDESVELEVRID